MRQKDSSITLTDQFCGAGGSSIGAERVLRKRGGKVSLALNHWDLAIETHNTNFPDTLHDCTDVSACDPRRYPSTNILITSPECTNHSLAKGQKSVKAQMDMFTKGKLDPAAERSRATMWDVCRFAEYHKYEVIVTENVVDARKWVMWDAWLMAMHSLGYKHKTCYFNSMHFYPTPQSRDRMYVVFWKKGNPAPDLEHRPLAHCKRCEKDVNAAQSWKKPEKHWGKFKTQYVYTCTGCADVVQPYYHAAFNIIDWSDPGSRIGDRTKPLADNTIKRIQYGLDKYGKDPFIFHKMYGKEARGVWRHVSDPTFTQVTLPTQAICMPFVVKSEYQSQPGYVRSVEEPLQTQAARQTMAMCLPFLTINRGQSKTLRSTDAISTQSSMITNGIITTEAWNSFIGYYYNGSKVTSHVTEPVGTMTAKDRGYLVQYNEPKVEDCYYRMIKPHEVQGAMAFPKDYVILGNSRQKVKQCGNAVTPPVMEWLIDRCVKSLS